MRSLAWLHPELWWTLPAALAILILWRIRPRRTFVAFSSVPWLAGLARRPSPLRRLPDFLAVSALAFVLVALLDPAEPYAETQVQSQGLDIVLVLDLSSSMQEPMARDRQAVRAAARSGTAAWQVPYKTRLDTTKEALQDFISRRRDDRIGLIVFSGRPYVVSPLTFDYDYLRRYIDLVDDQSIRNEGMTAIGEGIGLATYLLIRQSTAEERNKVIVVFTDGENNFGREPLQALTEADAALVRVHIVGVDLEDEVKRKPAVRGLIRMVQSYGGQYYNADTVSQLQAAYREIDALEKAPLTSTVYERNAPVYDQFALPGLVLLLAAAVLRAVPYFSDYT
jgi:Ca-activated chloride channel family protein